MVKTLYRRHALRPERVERGNSTLITIHRLGLEFAGWAVFDKPPPGERIPGLDTSDALKRGSQNQE